MTTQTKAEDTAGKKAGKKASKKVSKKVGKKVKKTGDMPRDLAGSSVTTNTDTDTNTGLIVWSADREASDPLVQVLKTVRALDLSETLPDPEDVQTGAQAPQMLLLCAAPLGSMCRQMAQGTPPSAALEVWRVQVRAVLAVNRRNRRRVHILDISQALRDPGSCLARFGVAAQAAQAAQAAAPVAPDDTSEAPDPVLLLLARRCLNEDAQARALAGELEAVMAAGGATVTDDPDAAFRSYREACWTREEAGLLRTQMSLMLEEMDLVQEQNRTAQQEVQGLSENAVLTQQRLAQLNQGIASYQAQLEELRATKAELSNKLAEQDIAMQADRDIAVRDADNARRELEVRIAELDATRERADGLQAWAHQLETSHSYRLTAPLRRVRALFSRVRE